MHTGVSLSPIPGEGKPLHPEVKEIPPKNKLAFKGLATTGK